MSKTFKVLAIVAITVIAASSVFAQNVTESLGSLSSNTKTATAGIFGNDVDSFVNYHKYSGVLNGAKWFGFISGLSGGSVGPVADLGYATDLGPLYLGAWYRGNIFKASGTMELKTSNPTYDDDLMMITEQTDKTEYQEGWLESANNIELLIGIAGMGIKVGFFESAFSNKNAGAAGRAVEVIDYMDGKKEYKNAIDDYSVAKSVLKPYIGWGGAFDLGFASLKPFVDFGLAIYSDSKIDNYSDYTKVNGEIQGIVDKKIGAGYNNGLIYGSGSVGAYFDLEKKDTVQNTIGLKYDIGFTSFSNADPFDLLGTVSGTVSWGANGKVNQVTPSVFGTKTETDIELTSTEQSVISHIITPSYKVTGEPVSGLKIGLYADVPVSFGSWSHSAYTDKFEIERNDYVWANPSYDQVWTHTRTNNAWNGGAEPFADRSVSNFGIGLNLNVGASYAVVPGRFAVNAGVKTAPFAYSQEVTRYVVNTVKSVETTITTDGLGNYDKQVVTVTTQDEDKVEVSDSWTEFRTTLFGGFTFSFNNAASIDLAASTKNGSRLFNQDIADVNVILTFKF